MDELVKAKLWHIDSRIDRAIAELTQSHKRLEYCTRELDDSSLQTEEAKCFVERFFRLNDEAAHCALSLIGELSTLRCAVKQMNKGVEGKNDNEARSAGLTFHDMLVETREVMEKLQRLSDLDRELRPAFAPPSAEGRQ